MFQCGALTMRCVLSFTTLYSAPLPPCGMFIDKKRHCPLRQCRYLLSKQGGLFGANRMVEFTVDPERVTINPFGKSGILGTSIGTGLLGLGGKQRPPIQVGRWYCVLSFLLVVILGVMSCMSTSVL